MIRYITRLTTSKCTLSMYMGFLISEPNSSNYTRLYLLCLVHFKQLLSYEVHILKQSC